MHNAYTFERPSSAVAGPIPLGTMIVDWAGYGVRCPAAGCPLILGTGSRDWAVRGADYMAHYISRHLTADPKVLVPSNA